MTEEDKIADMLLTWEEAREGGRVVTAEELCRDSPELLDAVRDRIQLLENAGVAPRTCRRRGEAPHAGRAVLAGEADRQRRVRPGVAGL